MKNKLLLFLVISCRYIFPQVDVTAGMGINYLAMPSYYEYINTNFASSADEIPSFSSAISLYGEVAYPVKENFSVGIEAAYSFSSITFFQIHQVELSYGIISPSAMAYYYLEGKGFDFKFGGGVGPRFTTVKQDFSVEAFDYNAVGFGFLLKGQGNTLLSESLYANINVTMRYDFLGEPRYGGSYIYNSSEDENVNLNNLALGVGLGLTYKF